MTSSQNGVVPQESRLSGYTTSHPSSKSATPQRRLVHGSPQSCQGGDREEITGRHTACIHCKSTVTSGVLIVWFESWFELSYQPLSQLQIPSHTTPKARKVSVDGGDTWLRKLNEVFLDTTFNWTSQVASFQQLRNVPRSRAACSRQTNQTCKSPSLCRLRRCLL